MPGVTATKAWRALAFRLSRIITPAFARELVLEILAIRATIVPLPFKG